MRSFKQIASTVRGEDVLEEGKKSLGTGWMLKADPKLGKAVKDKIDLAKKRQATYGDKSAGKSVKEETIEEGKRGLWDNIHAKRERIKKGSGERMRKPGSEGAPSEKDLKNSQTNEEVVAEETIHVGHRNSKGDWIKTSTHSNYPDANKAMKDLEAQGKKGVQHRYDNKGNIDPGMRTLKHEEVVLEGAPIVVMPRSDRFGTKKPAQPQRYMGDIVPPTKPPSTEKRGVKGRPGQRPMPTNEEVEQLDEMPGANMDTRAVHQHLKKRGWKLSRTSGSHDVYTHPEAKHHIPVPRHRQLKAPLVKGILKQAEINEQAESDTTEKTEMAQTQLHFIKYAAEEILEFIEMGGEIEEWYQNKLSKVQSDVESLHSYIEGESRRTGMKEEVVAEDKDYDDRMKKALDRAKTATPKKPADEYERKVVKYLKKKHDMKEEVGQTSNSNENPNAGRFASGPAKKPMKPTPIVTAEQTATDLGKERYEVPFDGPYAKNTKKVTTDKSGAKHTAMSRVKHLAKTAARKQAGLKEEQEPEDSYEKTSTPAKRSLSKTAGIVKDLAKNSKSSSKGKADTFQAEPELSSQIIKT
jgi:predicted RNA binding protein YcfA (HicA-like mRNA interferase family)